MRGCTGTSSAGRAAPPGRRARRRAGLSGFGWLNPGDVEGVFRGSPRLMAEREAFAASHGLRRRHLLSSTWPAAQQMCMHHELSYAHELPPGLMLFACLVAPSSGGTTGWPTLPGVLECAATGLVDRFEREGLAAGPQLQRRDRGVGRGLVRHRRPRVASRGLTAGRTRPSSPGSPIGACGPGRHRRVVVWHPVTGRRC
ncbi:TauD/TfdA family dioxygenase [Pseudonocardia sp. MCCB 268]|nr:TauD/TfdA family dioxygenase [Pseudonocardia cytotoxica]